MICDDGLGLNTGTSTVGIARAGASREEEKRRAPSVSLPLAPPPRVLAGRSTRWILASRGPRLSSPSSRTAHPGPPSRKPGRERERESSRRARLVEDGRRRSLARVIYLSAFSYGSRAPGRARSGLATRASERSKTSRIGCVVITANAHNWTRTACKDDTTASARSAYSNRRGIVSRGILISHSLASLKNPRSLEQKKNDGT